MTLSTVPLRPSTPPRDDSPGWAVVQIRPDGTLGTARLVEAQDPAGAVRLATSRTDATLPGPAALGLRVGLEQAAAGHLARAARSFDQGPPVAAGRDEQLECLGHLALAEADLGDLHAATSHARQVLLRLRDPRPGGTAHLALARVHLERSELEECGRALDLAATATGSPWVATSRLLVEAGLLAALGRPEAGTRVIARVLDGAPDSGPSPGWPVAALRTARADLLLAAGEPRRALAVVTPLPEETLVEASVVTAAGRLALGDHRGATAVLSGVAGPLEGAPLAVQVRAWLLEARVAHDRADAGRARRLVGRALHAASAEGLRAPLLRELPWLLGHVDRDPDLRHAHLAGLTELVRVGHTAAGHRPVAGPAPVRGGEADLLGAGLTERETQVLELLAQMCSTEEIATALYVSGNTVKTHLKGIFGKLCVNRRVDAVRRGRALGLC